MILPQATIVDGRLRIACVYEAELLDNPTPHRPSHRGAWILESDPDSKRLEATYFNDRGTRGTFIFDDHMPDAVAATFLEARALCESSLGSSWLPPGDTINET
jgi:hypothetical protein